MIGSLLDVNMRMLRASDSNSLLRLYDVANEILSKSPFLQQRERAKHASQRIAKELVDRKVKL